MTQNCDFFKKNSTFFVSIKNEFFRKKFIFSNNISKAMCDAIFTIKQASIVSKDEIFLKNVDFVP